MIFQNSGKNDDFSKKNLKNYYFFKFCQKMMISQNTSKMMIFQILTKNDDFQIFLLLYIFKREVDPPPTFSEIF